MPGWDVENNCVFCFESINRKWNKWWSDEVETEAVNDPLRKESLSKVSSARASSKFHHYHCHQHYCHQHYCHQHYCNQHRCHQHRCHQYRCHQHPIQDNYYWNRFSWKFSRPLLFSSYRDTVSWHLWSRTAEHQLTCIAVVKELPWCEGKSTQLITKQNLVMTIQKHNLCRPTIIFIM